MSNFEFKDFQGYFWLPEQPDQQLPGSCYRNDDNSIQLDVLGILAGTLLDNDKQDISRILGISEDGKLVTLENCIYKQRTFKSAGINKSSLYVNMVLVGCHINHKEDITFNEIGVYSDYINDWFAIAPIDSKYVHGENQEINLTYRTPTKHEWILDVGFKFLLRSTFTFPGTKSRYRKSCITQKTWAIFEFNTDTLIGELLGVIRQFNHFISFVIDKTLPINAVSAFRVIEDTKEEIKIYYSPDIYIQGRVSESVIHDALFKFHEVKERFGSILSDWYDHYDRFDSSFNLYFGTKSGRNLYLDNRFLMLAQALEAMHRHSSSETLYDSDEYSSLCKLLRQTIPGKFKSWIEARLEYGNELALRHRLKALFARYEDKYGTKKQVKSLISKIVKVRNYLTHYDPKATPPDHEELYKLCIALETLFQIHMINLCGFSDDEVDALVEKSPLLQNKLNHIMHK